VNLIRRPSAIAAWVLLAGCGDAAAPDTKAPTVDIKLSPCCLVTIPGTQVTIDAGATDNVGVEHVEFLARTPSRQTPVKFADDSTAPFSTVYPPAGFGNGDDGAYALSVKAYDAAGMTRGGFPDALLVKLDSSGAALWTRTFGAAGISEMAESVTRDVAGDVYIGVWRVGATTADRDCILVKYNAAGQEQWARVIDTGAQEQSCHVATDSSGAIYPGGRKGREHRHERE